MITFLSSRFEYDMIFFELSQGVFYQRRGVAFERLVGSPTAFVGFYKPIAIFSYTDASTQLSCCVEDSYKPIAVAIFSYTDDGNGFFFLVDNF